MAVLKDAPQTHLEPILVDVNPAVGTPVEVQRMEPSSSRATKVSGERVAHMKYLRPLEVLKRF
jgi:hypothetical protein